MRFRDALLLARTKFKTRRIRSILTALAAGFMLTILMIGSFFTTGVRNSISSAGGSTLEGRHFARQYQYDFSFDGDGALKILTQDEYTGRLQSQNVPYKQVFIEIMPNAGFTVIGDYKEAASADVFSYAPPFSVSVRNQELLESNVETGQSFDYDGTGPIPLLLSTDFVISQKKLRFDESDSAEARINKINEAKQEFVGAEIEVVVQDYNFYEGGPSFAGPDVPVRPESTRDPITFKVIGFSPAGSALLEEFSGSYSPVEVISKSPIGDLYSMGGDSSTNFITEFETKDDRDKFLETQCKVSDFTCDTPAEVWNDPLAKFNSLLSDFLGFFKYVIGFFASIVAISMFVTTSKVMSDSERETGVFRAIGAKRLDIVKIYSLYALLIATAAFVLTLVISILFGLYLTNKFGDSFAFQIAQFTGNGSVDTVKMVAFNPQHMAIIYALGAGAALLGAAIPILRAVQRDPIKAMRNE